jgi:isoquinoline 1-oxidoreductase alpha subunit
MSFTLNGEVRDVPAGWEDEPLLFLLREQFGLTGARFGCGVGLCGACTVIVDGVSARSCLLRAGDLQGRSVRTVEGLARGAALHPLQQAWLDLAVPQCGYCQAGQIMSAVALIEAAPRPTDAEIDAAMEGNLCRCGTYPRIRAAIARAAERA